MHSGERRPIVVGSGVFVGVAASFFAAVGLAHLHLAAMAALIAVLTGASTYGVVLKDLGRGRAAALALGMMVMVTGASLFVSYLAPMAFVATASSYLLARLWIQTRAALIVMGTAFGGLLALSAAVFVVAISQM